MTSTIDESAKSIPSTHSSSDMDDIEAAASAAVTPTKHSLTDSGLLSVDPFAPRKGKTLTWKNVNMTLNGTKNTEPRKLVDDVFGSVPERQTTAIMGPSGAG